MARKGEAAHVLLEVRADATPDQAQEAFHKVARTAHPDLHRHGLTPEELEMVTSAYAAVAGAYQTLRTQTMTTTRMRPISMTPPTGATTPRSSGSTTPPPITPSGPAPAGNAQQAMSPKALIYYRKAELALKRGDLKGAILQLKLACATDPTSAFLRSALVEVETEVRKAT